MVTSAASLSDRNASHLMRSHQRAGPAAWPSFVNLCQLLEFDAISW
jgi:hypothetical protein